MGLENLTSVFQGPDQDFGTTDVKTVNSGLDTTQGSQTKQNQLSNAILYNDGFGNSINATRFNFESKYGDFISQNPLGLMLSKNSKFDTEGPIPL